MDFDQSNARGHKLSAWVAIIYITRPIRAWINLFYTLYLVDVSICFLFQCVFWKPIWSILRMTVTPVDDHEEETHCLSSNQADECDEPPSIQLHRSKNLTEHDFFFS